jgi:archaellum component FlaG (FlaF/FlaG flagellin family)
LKSNNETQVNDNWAAIGIGAMIVFISLILVAAVASAVIVQTAEKLQQNAQRTGDDTSDELSGKLSIQSAFVQNGGQYVFYVRLGAGSDAINTVDISYQLFCAAGYETNQLAQANVQLQSAAGFGGGVTQLTIQNAYKIMITPGTCTAAAVAGASPPQSTLYLHVESGGTTYETLTVNNAADGSPVI